MANDHKEWYSRGYLPHFDVPNLIQSVTFRLVDSLPQSRLLEDWDRLSASERISRQLQLEDTLDSGLGSCLLGDSRCAAIVQARMLRYDGERYRLLAWAVMSNHVHSMFELLPGNSMGKVLQDWKGGSSFEINKLLGRSGAVWGREYHDRYMRDAAHYDNTLLYIEHNPVKAGLVKVPEEWPFSSAYFRAMREGNAG
ncbi:transposase [bacterium]|nr:transposase [bacterium]